MKHQVWFDETQGVLHVEYVGTVDIDNHHELIRKLNSISRLQKNLTLVDLSEMKMPRWDRKTRQALAAELNQEEYPKVAIIGANPILRMLARTFTPLLHWKQAIEFFESENDALIWLKSG